MATQELPESRRTPVLQRYSRFHGQRIFQNVDGRLFFGTFAVPVFPPSPSDTFRTVIEGEENRLDLISYAYYHTPELWWVIAVANDIVDPLDSISTGDTLRIPAINRVIAFLSS